jgi:signal transduction histidine kinase
MLPNERTTRSEVVAEPSQMEALVAAADREAARPLVELLRACQLNISVVGDAEAAFEEALLHRPHLLLIHEDLPPGGGIELCRRLKSNGRTHFLPAVLVPRSDRTPLRIEAVAAGADAVFTPEMSEGEKHAWLGALLRSSALRRRQERKQDSQRSALKDRGAWVSSFVHDLQNVTGALQANVEFLAQVAAAAPDKSEDVRDCARETRQLFQQLARGLRTVGDYERFESGHVNLRLATLALEELLAEVKEDLRWQASGARGRAVLEILSPEGSAARPGTSVQGDRDLLRQAFSALAAYLIRQPRTNRLLLRTAASAGEVRVILACDGEPIPDEDRERIFEPYVRLGRRLPPVQGLGLALARAVVDLHGGTVSAETDEGGGAAFVVRLKS